MPYLGSKAWFTSYGGGRYFPASWEGWLSLAICVALLVSLKKLVPRKDLQMAATIGVIGVMILLLLAKSD